MILHFVQSRKSHVWTLQLSIYSMTGIPDTKCCFKKEVGGIRYVLVAEEDTSALGCNANCIYAQDSDPESRYCFMAGALPVSCVNQEGKII